MIESKNGKPQVRVFLFFLLLLLPALVYCNSLPNSFHYDDAFYILGNSYTHSLSGIPHFFISPRLISNVALSGFRPLTMTSFALNYAVGGANPFVYHLTNVLIHIANTLLVFGVSLSLMRIFEVARGRYGAFAAAAVFACHPLNTQAVNYISARSTLLVGGFSLMCVLFYVRRYEVRAERKAWLLLGGSILAYAGALLSKEEAVAIPGILAFFELARLRPSVDKQWLKRVMLSLLPFFVVTLAFLLYVVYDLRIVQDTPQARGLGENLLAQAKSVIIYLKLMIIPTGLSIDHAVGTSTAVSGPGPMLAVLAVAILLLGSLSLLHTAPLVALGVWWFILALVPTSTLVALKLVVNEQRMYLAGVGLLIAAAAAAARVIEKHRHAIGPSERRYITAGFLILLVCLSSATIERNARWRTPLSLWSDTLAKNPDSARANTIVAGLYLDDDRPEYALRLAEKAVRLAPDVVEPRLVLSRTLSRLGEHNRALEQARAAVDLSPGSTDAQTLLGIAYARLDRHQEAKAAWERALELDPQNVQARENLDRLDKYFGSSP